ncbi:MAG: PQQ-dependent sugar dehydrogenase [Immundisolibacteraceae bacterium]|nr:PQQ-dependent sugar dehydrogenase [Immundisolibacteraceae bacterium]
MSRMALPMKNSSIQLPRVLLAITLGLIATVCTAIPAIERLATVYSFDDGSRVQVEVIARGLHVPWGMAFTPAGGIIVSERIGRLQLISANGSMRELDSLPQVYARDESGLMGIALHSLSRDQLFIYLCYSERKGIFGTENVLIKAMLGRFGLLDEQELLRWQGDRFHNGCQVAIGPDQLLYVTTGDATEGDNAQDLDSLLGKLLRLQLDGSIPTDNPFSGSPVYSFGHRNPQGLSWQDDQIFLVEHGPSGFDGPRGSDELNRIQAGGNYGWPEDYGRTNGSSNKPGDSITQQRQTPILLWDQSIAPAGLLVYRGDKLPRWRNQLFVAALAGESLVRVALDDRGDPVDQEVLFKGEFGRIRAVAEGPDGYLYFTTSNLDGRGTPRTRGDLLLRVVPAN